MKKYVLIIVICAMASSFLFAREGQKEGPHNIGLFAGPTYINKTSVLAATARLYYEFQTVESIGYGFNAQFTIGSYFETLVSVPIYYYPIEKVKFWGAPGIGFLGSYSYSKDVPEHLLENIKNEKIITGNFFLALGMGYTFDLSQGDPSYHLTPIIEFQIINMETLYISLGVSFGMEFLYLTPPEKLP